MQAGCTNVLIRSIYLPLASNSTFSVAIILSLPIRWMYKFINTTTFAIFYAYLTLGSIL
jgi:hypothetical protein